MTPLKLSMLICYATTRSDYRNGDFSAPAVREAIEYFKEKGFLRLTEPGDSWQTIYTGTEKAEVFVNALCAVPEPIQQWIVPATQPQGNPT